MPGSKGRTLIADADVVRELRVARGLSRSRLVAMATQLHRSDAARWTTLSISTLRRLEVGQPVLLDALHTVAHVLGADVHDMLSAESRAQFRSLAPDVLQQSRRPPPADERQLINQKPPEQPGRSAAVRSGTSNPIALRVRLHCEMRFQTIIVDYHERVRLGRVGETRFWRLYWSHQIDQFQYWKEGLLDDRTFRRWMEARAHDYATNWKVKRIDYRTAWKQFRDWTPSKDFVDVIELVFAGNVDAAMRR